MTVLIPGLYGLDSYSAWRSFAKEPAKYLDRFAKDKTVVKEIDYFNQKAPTLKDVDALLKDRRAFQYLLDAYGLGSEINNAGRIKKILTQDPTDENSLVNKLADTRFKAMADSLRLDLGMEKLQRSTFLGLVKDKYVQNQFEVNLGEQDPSLRQAAYFARNSGSISDVYKVLGDSILRDVVQTTFSIPQQLAIQPVETQARALSSRVDSSKFSGIANASVSASELTRAKGDFSLLESSLAVSDKAIAQIKILQGQLDQLVTNYTNVSGNTDPGGPNAATIALQQTAVPELVRFEQLLNKGTAVTDQVSGQLDILSDFIAQAQDPATDLAALKTQFSSFVSVINTALDNATITAPDGSTQNILLNGAADTISITLDDIGTTVTINRYDATAIKNSLLTADASFNAIADSSDTANIYAAQGRILIATDSLDAIRNTLATDQADFAATVAAEPFYATLNTVSLQQGSSSVDDALDRLTKVEDLIDKIGDLAAESKARDSIADRTDLEALFNSYRTELRDLIDTPGAAGLDNFLNNIPDQSYEISAGFTIGVKGGYDLLASVADILDAGSLSDQTAADALQISAIMVTTATDTARAGLEESEPYLTRALGTYDPKGSLNKQISDIKRDLSDFIAAAATEDGKNLLSVDQSDISVTLTTGTNVRLRAQSTFEANFTAALDAVLTQITAGDEAATLMALKDAAYLVDTTQRTLSSDSRFGTLEMGKLGGIIDTLTPQDTTDAENPYKMNVFTEKFLLRYLTQASLNAGTTSGPNSYVLSLFSGSSNGSGNDSSSAFSSIMSLSMQV